MEKQYFPMFVDISQKDILVVGGGRIAARRVETLLKFAEHITVVSPELNDRFKELVQAKKVTWIARDFEENDLTGRDMVLAATNQHLVNQQVTKCCREQGILINTADDKTQCDFYFPGMVVDEDVVIGISTGGEHPEKVREIKKRIKTILPL